MKTNKYYSVHKGHETGIFNTWNRCQVAIKNYSNPIYKSFKCLKHADYFFKYGRTPPTQQIIEVNPIKLNDPNTISVFTDGSSINNGKSNAKGGYGVWFSNNDIRNVSEHLLEDSPTNNKAELQAIITALQILIKEDSTKKNIFIYSDSNYCIQAITKWSKNWIKNNWQTKNNTPVTNKNRIILALELYVKFSSIQFIHVNSHLTEPSNKNSKEYFQWYGNKQVDILAVNGAKQLN